MALMKPLAPTHCNGNYHEYIAHRTFSRHARLSLQGIGPKRFLNKRWTGAVNLGLNRSRHYRVDIFERLLDAVVASQPDHSVCTGTSSISLLSQNFVRWVNYWVTGFSRMN